MKILFKFYSSFIQVFTYTDIKIDLQFSLLPFHHDDVITKLGFDGWVSVHWVGQRAGGQGECRILERPHHTAPGHPSQVPLKVNIQVINSANCLSSIHRYLHVFAIYQYIYRLQETMQILEDGFSAMFHKFKLSGILLFVS